MMRRIKASVPAGFTLIEVMIVVVIISVIAGVTLLSVDVTGNQKARTFVKEIRFLMQTLSHEAILSGNPYGLQWERKEKRVVPVIYRGNRWSRAPAQMRTIPWRGFAEVSLIVDGIVIGADTDEELEREGVFVVNSRGSKTQEKGPDLPEILFWSTGLWDPAGQMKIEIEGLPYADIIWTSGGRTTVKYPDADYP